MVVKLLAAMLVNFDPSGHVMSTTCVLYYVCCVLRVLCTTCVVQGLTTVFAMTNTAGCYHSVAEIIVGASLAFIIASAVNAIYNKLIPKV